MDYKNELSKLINIEGVTPEETAALIAVPKESGNGDFSLPCFRFAKALHKSPAAIAEELAASCTEKTANDDAYSFLSKTEAKNGYLNFYLDKNDFTKKTISKVIAEGDDYGASDIGRGKTVCIDYSSVNIAKPFHMGHLSTTVIGAALYRTYKFLGFDAVGINHLGDWGTQFGTLIVAYKKWGSREDIEKRGVAALLEIYVKFYKEAEKNPELEEEARYWFKQIEDGNPEALDIFNWFKEITLAEAQKTYKRLHVTFDSYAGESFYNDKMQPVIDELKDKGLLKESDGAQVVDLSDYNMPPCLIIKADGATLYATRDLAAAFYRKKTYDFYKCLYVVAYQQNLHFKQWFKVIELMGYDWYKDLVHVAFGMVSMEDGAMSTRKGKVVFLEDVLNRTVDKAYEILCEKSAALENKRDVAEVIGVGAVVFGALYNSRIKDIVFSYDRVLSFEGETGPYVQYTHARCTSVLARAEITADVDYSSLDNPEGNEVVKCIAAFPQSLNDCIEKYEPCNIARSVMAVCQAYNKFYFEHRIIDAPEAQRNAMLLLTKATKQVIKTGLSLLGIQAPDKM